MSPLEPPPDYINSPPPVSPLTTCSLIPGPFLPPQSQFSLALLRAPTRAHVELHSHCCLVTSGPAAAKCPWQQPGTSFPQLPPCCQECGRTQHLKSFNPCSTAELRHLWFSSCFPSHGLGWCSHTSCTSQQYGNSLESPPHTGSEAESSAGNWTQ